MTRGNIQDFCFNEIMLLKKLAFQYRPQKLLSDEWHVKTGSLVKPGMTGVQPGMMGAQPGMAEARPGMTGAQPGMTGAQAGMTGAARDDGGAAKDDGGSQE